MKVLIIEDEVLGAERLFEMLQSIDVSIEVIGRIESISQGIEWFRQHHLPDLIFLDIELTDGQSFALFQEVEIHCPVIFTTSYNEYALKAFELNSIDYLLKPIRKEQLQKALDKFHSMKQALSINAFQVEQLLQLYSKKTVEYRNRFLVKYGQKHLSISIEQIAFFFGEDKVAFLVTYCKDKYVIDYTLDDLESLLDPLLFFRANRSFIVSVQAVQSVKSDLYGKLKLQLVPSPTKEVIISRGKASVFKNWLGK